MRPILVFLILLIVSTARSQNFREKELKTTLNEVTVFLDGAQFFESGIAAIPADRSLLRITNLSPYINEKSIQVKADGNVTPIDLSSAIRDEKSDQLTWHQTLDPQQQKEITLQYEVKYPKRERIVLE